MIYLPRNRNWILIAAIFCCIYGNATAAIFPILKKGDEVQLSVCTPDKLRELKQSVVKLKISKSLELWKGIQIMLCGDATASNITYVTKMLSKKIHATVEGTGQESHQESIEPSEVSLADLFAKGNAFDAMTEKTTNGIELFYSPNEACVESRRFAYVGKRWQLVYIGQACD